MAKVPDERLEEKLAALYQPKKTVYATVEYADVAAIGQEGSQGDGVPDGSTQCGRADPRATGI